MLCLISFSLSVPLGVAAEKTTSYEQIFQEYDLKTVTAVPTGVSPIVIDSEQELLDLLQKIENSIKQHSQKEKNPITIERSNTGSDISIQAVTDYLVDQINVGGHGTVSLRAKVYDNGYRITGCVEYTKLTGFTFGYTWTLVGSDSVISSDGKDVYVWAEGELEFWLLIEGGLKLWTKDVSLDGYLTIFH